MLNIYLVVIEISKIDNSTGRHFGVWSGNQTFGYNLYINISR
ncbi:hypothetical protein [Candidatus Hodgkinia cicadicola]